MSSSSVTTSSKSKICIATPDIIGPTRNGGIGTAYFHLATTLVEAGHDVTILYTLGDYSDNDSRTLDEWIGWYQERHIEFVPLALSSMPKSAYNRSLDTYEWLKEHDFDVVHFPDWQGGGYHTCLHKQRGGILAQTTLVIGLHSPTYWHKVHDGMQPENFTMEDDLVDFIERAALALCDVIVSPSQYLLDWCKNQGWTLCAQQQVIQNCYPVLDEKEPVKASGGAISELVFFGRLETRKGVVLFCEALKKLSDSQQSLPTITFLGKSSLIEGEPSEKSITTLLEGVTDYTIKSDLSSHEAVEYLSGEGRVAVIASLVENSPYVVLECLREHVPFIASYSGGIPELIEDEYHDSHCFEPQADMLAQRLVDVLDKGIDSAPVAVKSEEVLGRWKQFHEECQALALAPSEEYLLEYDHAALEMLGKLYHTYVAQTEYAAQLYGDVEHQKKIIAQHNATIASIQKNVLDFKHKLAFSLRDNTEQRDKNRQLKTQVSNVLVSLEDSKKHIADLQQHEKTLQKGIADYQRDMAELQNNYDIIRTSVSWKITRPFRVIRRWFIKE